MRYFPSVLHLVFLTMARTAKSASPDNFEAALAELETLVNTMENGDLPLESAMEAYQRGNMLLQFCQGKLAETEQRIRILEGDTLKPFSPSANASAE